MNNNNYKEILKSTHKEDKLVILYFTASWCNPCKQFLPIVQEVINKLSKDNGKLFKFFLIDIDDDDKNILIDEFNIKSVPTLILLDNNDILDSFTGKNTDKLTNMLKIGKNRLNKKGDKI